MNERTYLKSMSALKKELERAQNAEPPDSESFNDMIDMMNDLNNLRDISVRRKHLLWRVFCIVLCLLLAWLIS